MRAEVIAIGDELTTGQRLDTNTQWLSQRLTELGVQVAFHTTITDELADNVAAFQAACQRADIVVSTGGLGPTADDLTRDAIATATGTKLVRDTASLAHIEQLFASRGREMPERNRVQADFPAGSVPIYNPHGTAPGIEMAVERNKRAACTLFALPGVPAEMIEMWEATVASRIVELQPEPRVIRHRRIKCFGVGESALEAMLPNLISRDREPRVGITVSHATITLRITATASDEAACNTAMEPTVETIYDSLGNLIFGEGDDELEHAVVRLLKERRQTLAVADLGTAGLLAEWLQRADTDSTVFVVGQDVNVSQVANPHSSTAASALAEKVRSATQADIGLAVAAYPPDVNGPPDANGPSAHVCVAIALPERTRKLRFPCAAHPSIVRSRTAKQALNALRMLLL